MENITLQNYLNISAVDKAYNNTGIQSDFDLITSGMTAMEKISFILGWRCNQTLMLQPHPDDGNVYCDVVFDGWMCWNYTLAGTRAYQECPTFLRSQYGVPPPNARAFKDCRKDGTWWPHPESRQPWTDYTQCSASHEDLLRVIYVYYSGYGLSIFLLLFALVIFTYFKQLHCSRITLHKHLFFTYILSGASWILLYALLENPYTLKSSPLWCQILHVVTQYFTLCNYAWMFCEGYYLHALIVLTFTNEKKLLITCYTIGWAVPLIPTAIYAGVRGSNPELRQRCWIDIASYRWILLGPVIFSLFVNFISLFNILRILLSKLRAVNTNENHQWRRAVRAVLILIPLFGLQHLLIPLEDTDSKNAHIYDIISAVLTSFQGVFVALLFCFLNGEVLGMVKRKWNQMRDRIGSVDIRRSNTFNVSLLETTYVPKSTAGRSSLCKQTSSSPTKGANDVYMNDCVPYHPVHKEECALDKPL